MRKKRCRISFTLISGVLFLSLLSVPFSAGAESKIFDEVIGIDGSGNVEKLTVITPTMVLSSRDIYHHEMLNVFLYGLPDLVQETITMRVIRNGKIHPSASIERTIPFFRDYARNHGRLRAVYLPGWNEDEGEYEIELYYGEKRLRVEGETRFRLKRREVPAIGKFLSVVDLEMNESIRRRTFTDTSGQEMDYRAILEWARFIRADALWILSGETTSFSPRRRTDTPWDRGPMENLYLLKQAAKDYGLQIGAYIMCFYVPGNHGIPERYEAGLGYDADTGSLYRSRHISLLSETRIQDIIDLAKSFQEDDEVDYIGFDFIRTGRVDGYEMGPLVIHETNIQPPQNWDSLSQDQKIKWFARKVEVDRDPIIIEKWRWWRAHRVSQILQRVIEEAQITKPVWVYTLGWNHGKEHGQDPVMFFDAGVSIDAVMLYEANRMQFVRLLEQWNSYLPAGKGNIIVGNCIDYRLLDSEYLSPPDELKRRYLEGYQRIIHNGHPAGMFLHDISRAFWGRRGEHSIEEYLLAYLSSVQRAKNMHREADLLVQGAIADILKDAFGQVEFSGHLLLKNRGIQPLENIKVTFFDGQTNKKVVFYHDGKSSYSSFFELGMIPANDSIQLDFTLVHSDDGVRMDNIGFKIGIEDNGEYRIIKLNELKKPESIERNW